MTVGVMMAIGTEVSKGARVARFCLRAGFVIGVTALSWWKLPAAIVAICAIILVAVHGKANTVIELSFGPLRAKLERDLSDAEKLVEKLRLFAFLQVKAVVSAATRTNRWADSRDDWQFANLKAMEAALRDLGVSDDELKEARSDLVKMTVRDLGNAAMGLSYVPTKLGPEAVAEWQALKKSGAVSSPDEVEAYLKKYGELTPERASRIADMRWVIENHDIRDRDQFLRAHDPIEWQQ